MISLAVMFNELLELSEVSARNGDCFEDIAGEIYLKSVFTDLTVNLIQIAGQKVYTRYRPIKTGFLSLNYSGNPGVNGVSYRSGTQAAPLQVGERRLPRTEGGATSPSILYVYP